MMHKYKISKKRLEKDILGRKVNLKGLNKEKLRIVLNEYFEGNRYGKVERRLEIRDDAVLIGFTHNRRRAMNPSSSEMEPVKI